MERLKAIAAWIVRGLLFLFILLFAMKNADPMTLKFYFGQSWQAPVALVLFVALAIGAALGLIAALQRIFAQRRDIQRLERELELARASVERRQAREATPPVPDLEPPAPERARPE